MQTPIEIYEILKAKLITNESDIAIINNILCIKPSLILLEFTFLLINACKYPVKMKKKKKIRGVIICHIKLEKFKFIKKSSKITHLTFNKLYAHKFNFVNKKKRNI